MPHWTLEGATYHVVFRLADSLPAGAVAKIRAERETFLIEAKARNLKPDAIEAQLYVLFSQRIESILDHGLGQCWLARDDLAGLTADTLQHFNGSRYQIHAWCVMPNHVHIIVQPRAGHALPEIMKSWKGFIAREANRRLELSGEFWQPEYYDHLIRDESDFAHAMEYVRQNPEKAGLKNWRWVWP